MSDARSARVQEACDRFYAATGPCCAGCDWWQPANSVAGQCTRSAPVPGAERVAMLGIQLAVHGPAAGHIMTPREHRCGEFKDSFDWSSLSPLHLKRIGRTA